MAEPFQKRECPYTPARLQEMYRGEGKTPVQIADHCESQLQQSRPHRSTVLRWLKDACVTLRTKKEALALYARQHPGLMKKRAENFVGAYRGRVIIGRKSVSVQGDASQMRTPKALRNLRKAAAKRAAPLVTKRCAICGAEITKKAHRFQGIDATCSRDCKMTLVARLKTQQAMPIQVICPQCGNAFSVSPSRLKHGVTRPCCSRACSNRYTKTKSNPTSPPAAS